jgi:hypothetical protein
MSPRDAFTRTLKSRSYSRLNVLVPVEAERHAREAIRSVIKALGWPVVRTNDVSGEPAWKLD